MASNLAVADPLLLLRDFAVKKKKDLIALEDGFISFGETKFPAKTLTRFHDSKGKAQTLDALWFCLAQENKPFSGAGAREEGDGWSGFWCFFIVVSIFFSLVILGVR